MSRGAPAKTVRNAVASTDRISVAFRLEPRREDVPILRAGYLPECGPSPLRFAEPQTWPSPLPTSQAESSVAEKKPEPADASTSVAPAAEISSVEEEERPESIVISAGSSPRERPPGADTGPLLTSDLVLGYLGDRPSRQGGIRTSFEPATPPEASQDAPVPPATPAATP